LVKTASVLWSAWFSAESVTCVFLSPVVHL